MVLSGEICFRLLDLVLVLDFLGGNGSGSGGRGIGRRHRWILLRLLQLQQLLLVYRLFRGDSVSVIIMSFSPEEKREPRIVFLLGLSHGFETGAIPRHKLPQLLNNVLQFRIIWRLCYRHFER